jgi:drug/metabolite transporter (DMT)-like permease
VVRRGRGRALQLRVRGEHAEGDFGKLLGVYVTLFFLVAQLIAWIFFHETPSRAVVAGGALILSGGAVITWWR